MSQITNNIAAWLPYEKATKMEIGVGPTPNPTDKEVVIKVAYAAVNPADWKARTPLNSKANTDKTTQIQDAPPAFFKPPYPLILGIDVAGTIADVGSKESRFKIGDRVIGHCDSLLTQKKTNSGFQLYTTCLELLVCHVPDTMSLSSAAVLPLSIDTAATGLFKHLKLPLPSVDPKPNGQSILIWGGSSSVGSAAIQ
jgi:NADPH:quinone reductase-like Zn-dependent oxidoreductase